MIILKFDILLWATIAVHFHCGAQHDAQYVLSWNHYTMKLIGIWPEERKWNRLSSYVILIPTFMVLGFIWLPQMTNLMVVWDDLNSVTELLSMAHISVTIAFLKMILTWANGKPLNFLLKCMIDDWDSSLTSEKRETMEKVAKIVKSTVLKSTIMCSGLVIAYTFLRYFGSKNSTKMLFRGSFPYEIEVSPNYQLTMIAQFISGLYAASSYTSVDTFVCTLILHVCGQLTNLRREIINLPSSGDKDFQIRLGKIVQRHIYLNRFAETIENCFNLMLLLQMLGSTIQLCFQCFQVITSFGVVPKEYLIPQILFLVLYVLYVVLYMYLYCYMGEKLSFESEEIASASYDSEWYNLSAKNTKLFIVIVSRARIPLRITAGKFCSFSLLLYSQILKTSISYISVMYTMKYQ